MNIYDISLSSSEKETFSDKSCWRENPNTLFMLNVFSFLEIMPCMRQRVKIWQSRTAYRWQYNMAHALYMADN